MLIKLLRTLTISEGGRVHRVGSLKWSVTSEATPYDRRYQQNAYLPQEVHGRTVTVLKHNGKVYAIDTACFHQGGPLGTQGDIEDVNGVTCLRCPWHGYRVSNLMADDALSLRSSLDAVCVL